MLNKRVLLFSLAAIAAGSTVPVSAEEKANAADPSVKLATVGIPVMSGNQVVNYLFLSIRINLTAKANENKIRDMEPYFRDVLVRVSHSVSFGQPDHSDLLDEQRFKAVMTVEWSKITGAGAIKSIDILSQSPKRHLS